MEALTISEGFRKAIGIRTVRHAFFSTYCFEPDFFELEVLPLLLGNPALSSNEAIRYVQLQSLMWEHQNRFAVAYDVDVFNPELAPHLEVDYLPIRVDGACQHAKIAVIELVDKEGAVTLLLAAGSFNLTKSGWWENIEVGHWVELTEHYSPSNIAEPLLNAIAYFQSKPSSQVLNAIHNRLQSFKLTAKDPNCSFYFSGEGRSRIGFTDFIDEYTKSKGPLEIVSPFFAEDGNNSHISEFLKKFKNVSLLLPFDNEGKVPIANAVYDDLLRLPVTWCQWQEKMRINLGIASKDGPFRKLHAKIYQCLSPKPWIFLGSVNLSYKAFSANVEAGFFLQGVARNSLLTVIENDSPEFSPVLEAEQVATKGSIHMPVFHVTYDWQNSILQLTSSKTGELKLYDNSEAELQCFEMKQGETQRVFLPKLKDQLGRTSLVIGVWRTPQQEGAVRRNLLISQHNLFCRPNSLPAMVLLDLLRIFQDMHAARRTELMAELASRMIRLQQDGTLVDENAPPMPIESDAISFFSEFSQVNGAFWMLKERLNEAQLKGQIELLAYYLKGCQPDSLRGVIDALESEQVGVSPPLVVRYLTLLSVDELLALYPSEADPQLVIRVAQVIAKTEEDRGFDEIPNKTRFLLWIKQKFRQPIKEFNRIESTIGEKHAGN